MFKDAHEVDSYVFLNNDPYLDWVLREKSTESANVIVDLVEAHVDVTWNKAISTKTMTDSAKYDEVMPNDWLFVAVED